MVVGLVGLGKLTRGEFGTGGAEGVHAVAGVVEPGNGLGGEGGRGGGADELGPGLVVSGWNSKPIQWSRAGAPTD